MATLHQFRFILVLLLGAFSMTSSLTPEQRRLIDELVEIFMRDNHTPGLALSIVEGGGNSTLSIAYGKSRLETDTAATSQTLFAIGSISKSFTGAVAAKVLHEKFPELGESVLDTPIKQLAPDFNFTFSDRYRSEFTSFRDILSHRTCLFNYGIDLSLGMNSQRDYLYRTRYQLESCPFRAGYEYNNNLFSLAGHLIAHIAGVTYEELMNNFFLDLGMRNTRLVDENGAHEVLPTMSHAYFRKPNDNQTYQYNTTHLRRIAVVGGAGAILSTANDMTQYLKFHLNKGRVGTVQVMPENVYGWVIKSASILPIDADPVGSTGFYAYGLGLILAVYNSNPWILHGGYWSPYESNFGLFPQQKHGVFISTNGPGSAGTYPGQLPQQLLQLMIFDIIQGNRTNLDNVQEVIAAWPKPKPGNNSSVAAAQKRKQEAYKMQAGSGNLRKRTQTDPEDIVGRYGSPADGEAVIALDGQRIGINFGSYGLGTLVAKNGSDTVFGIEWISPVEDDFYSYGNIGEVPKFETDFGVENQFELRTTTGESIVFIKDRVLDSVPAIPWEPESCGPAMKK